MTELEIVLGIVTVGVGASIWLHKGIFTRDHPIRQKPFYYQLIAFFIIMVLTFLILFVFVDMLRIALLISPEC